MNKPLDVPADYRPLDERSVIDFVAEIPGACEHLASDSTNWSARETGDGNLNLIFIVKGAAGGVVVKQALPYLRVVGEAWALPLKRAFFENEALAEQANLVPELLPKRYHQLAF